jgi:DNA-directed RNA polymerase specialized sigma subunit
MKFLLLLLNKIIICNCLHLSPIQSDLIIKLIKNPQLTINQRKYINNVLYNSYEKRAIKKAVEFKKSHYNKCKNIIIDDLIMASKFGLYKSILKYNGNSPFLYFSNFYIDGELFKIITNYFSISSVPKSIRIKNKSNFTTEELLEYKKNLFPIYVSSLDDWYFDKYKHKYPNNVINNFEKLNDLGTIWNSINNLDPLLKQIIYLKYDFEFNKIRSNSQIGNILCYSSEYIRITLKKMNYTIIDCGIDIVDEFY